MNKGQIARNEYRKDDSYIYLNNLRSDIKNISDTPIDKMISVFVNRSLLFLYKSNPLNLPSVDRNKKEAMDFLLLDIPLIMVDSIMGKEIKIEGIDNIFHLLNFNISDIEKVDYKREQPKYIEYIFKDNPKYKVFDANYIKTSKSRVYNISNEYILTISPLNTFKKESKEYLDGIDEDGINIKEYNIKEYLQKALNIPYINNFFEVKRLSKDYFIKETLAHIEEYLESEYNIVNFNKGKR